MKKIIICVICILAVICILSACNKGTGSASADQATPIESTPTTYTVKTDYAVLTLPYQYLDVVNAEVKEDCVSLMADKQQLFDLYFNSDQGTVLGTFQSDNGEITLSMTPYEAPADSDYVAMQDDCLNEILKGLQKDYSFTPKK